MKKILIIFLFFVFVLTFSLPAFAFTASFEPDDNTLVLFPSEVGLDNFSVTCNQVYTGDSDVIISDSYGEYLPINIVTDHNVNNFSYIVHSDEDTQSFDRGYIKYPCLDLRTMRDDVPTPSDLRVHPEFYLLTDGNPSTYTFYLYYDFCYYNAVGHFVRNSYVETYRTSTSAWDINLYDIYYSHFDSSVTPYAYLDNIHVTFESNTANIYGVEIYCDDIFYYYGDEVQPPNLDVTINSVNPDVTGWLFESLNGFFSVEIFDNVTLGNIFSIALAVPIVIWFLKLFAGG